jgi:two-component system, sensor histidine kinase and response regulator
MAKIVIIDDDALMCNMIIETLAEKGHETFSALDGRAGIALIENKLPDLVISDIMMPELDGYQCLELIRSNSRIDTIPVILLSGINEFGAIRKGMVLGADDYLVKPFSHEDLSAAVETQLKKRALIRNHHETTLSLLRKNIVYSLPHEFRTPLQLIMGHGHLLDMTYNSATPVDIQESARVIVSAGKRLQRLIENCLVYTQLELADEKEKLSSPRSPAPAPRSINGCRI